VCWVKKDIKKRATTVHHKMWPQTRGGGKSSTKKVKGKRNQREISGGDENHLIKGLPVPERSSGGQKGSQESPQAALC